MHEIARDSHLNLTGPHSHLKQKFIKIDVLGANRVGVCVVADEVEFELDNSEHGGFEHILE